ncbi:MAG: class II glutamine amidotransferase [Deltaproteobacteria bacterium]|nr:class II glutamine amidotransferase [Deltaproteobacteria bacterium]
MCRMIAFASTEPVDVSPYLGHLSEFARSGNFVEEWEKRPGGNHPDGWGIAWRQGDEIRVVRSGKPACADPQLFEVRMRTDRFIGHVRYASNTATVNAANSHPFFALGAALAHNGTFGGTIGEEANRRNVSDTLVFLERLGVLWRERSFPRLAEAIAEIIDDPESVGDYSAANLLIASGESLFALRRFRRREDYYTLYLRTSPGQVVVASQPLGGEPGWRPLGNGELVEMDPRAPRSVFLPVTA